MDTDVHKGPESGHVSDDSRKLHPWLQILHLVDTLLEGEELESRTRITSGLAELFQDVLERGQTYLFRHVNLGLNLLPCCGVLQQVTDRATHVTSHRVHHCVALRMDGTGVQRMHPFTDA